MKCRTTLHAVSQWRRLVASLSVPDTPQFLYRFLLFCNCLCSFTTNKLCGRPPQYDSVPCKLTFDLLNLKAVSESHVTWATCVPILVFLGLSVLDLVVVVVVVVVVEYLYSASRSASNALIVPQRCEEMCL